MWRKAHARPRGRSPVKRVALWLLLSLALAGCTASGSDPFEYTRKPLYAGGFDLARLPAEGEGQQFRVTDGSIGQIHLLVWVNATADGARVWIADPDGATAVDTTSQVDVLVPLELGVWTVRVEPTGTPTGLVHLLALRG